jgi:hypothetical protein
MLHLVLMDKSLIKLVKNVKNLPVHQINRFGMRIEPFVKAVLLIQFSIKIQKFAWSSIKILTDYLALVEYNSLIGIL